MEKYLLLLYIKNIWPIMNEILVCLAAIATIATLFVGIFGIVLEIHKYKQAQKNKRIKIIDNLIIELRLNSNNELQIIQNEYEKHITESTFPVIKLKTEIINEIFKMLTIYDEDLVVAIMEVRNRLNLINDLIEILKQGYIVRVPIAAQKFHLSEMNRLAKELFVRFDPKEKGLLISGGLIKKLIEKLEKYKERVAKEDYE